jgi:hypothetical protein
MGRIGRLIAVLGACLPLSACGGSEATGGAGGAGTTASTGAGNAATTTTGTGTATTDAGGCALADDTTPTSVTSPSGCHVETRDTSACAAQRTAQGLSGFWLELSCRVSLSKTTQNGAEVVMAAADGQPDYKSEYFAMTSACYEDEPASVHNPNTLEPQTYVVTFPLAPDDNAQKMTGAVVGLALNGVPIFGNFAAPGDDIYQEAMTFDTCGGHPQGTGAYHYHAEPYSISYDDDHFIGVMRDGYPVYGRLDPGGAAPTLDAYGGHTGVTADSPTTPVYHYHVNQQTSTAAGTAGQKQWFLTTGSYRGTPGGCGSCN